MKCGLVGKTLKHSYSPKIHEYLGEYSYDLFSLNEDEFENFIKNGDYDALNITIPYKQTVIPLLDEVSPLASEIGAVNTVVKKHGKLYGYNTDILGLDYMLKSVGIELKNRTVMILGSGGTSKTATVLAQKSGAKKIIKVSRTGEINYQNCYEQSETEVIINTTPVGMFPDSYIAPIKVDRFPKLKGVADVVYNPSKTLITYSADKLGVPSVNGLSMLVAQAKYASDLFTGNVVSEDKIPFIAKELIKQTENLTLIGMAGCGKSTIGKTLAKLTGKKFIDTDELIVSLANKNIEEIFAIDGEDKFRELESDALKIAENERGAIIATGGGIVKRQENHYPLSSNGKVVWLKREVTSLSRQGRPLSKDLETVKKMYEERKPLYKACADYSVDNSKNIEEVAKEILSLCEYSL